MGSQFCNLSIPWYTEKERERDRKAERQKGRERIYILIYEKHFAKKIFKICFNFYKCIFRETVNLKNSEVLHEYCTWSQGLQVALIICCDVPRAKIWIFKLMKKNSKYHATLKRTLHTYFLWRRKDMLSWTRHTRFFLILKDQDVFDPTCKDFYRLTHDLLRVWRKGNPLALLVGM